MKTAVVGVGYLGYFHAQKYAALDGAELVAVVDPIRSQADKAAKDHGCSALTSHLDLIGRVDAVSVACTTRFHYQTAKDLLRAGIHCLIEKPMTAKVEEADELIDLAEAHGALIQVGHLERFNPAVAAVDRFLDRPKLIEARRLTPYQNRGIDVDVALDLMIHDLDLIMAWAGQAPETIMAAGAAVTTARTDAASAWLKFPGGLTANLTASRISDQPERRIMIYQPDSHLAVDCGQRTVHYYHRAGDEADEVMPGVVVERHAFGAADPLALEIADFMDCIRTGRQPLVGGREARRALAAAVEVNRQIVQGGDGGV